MGSCGNDVDSAHARIKEASAKVFVIPSEAEESLTVSEISRDISTSLDMTKSQT